MNKLNSKYLFLGVFIIIVVLAFLVIKPFIHAILSSIVLAYLFTPFYNFLSNKMNKSLAAFIIVIITILLFVIPTFFITKSLVTESISLYNSITEYNLSPVIQDIINRITEYLTQQAQTVLRSIPGFLINVFITLVLFYYFLKEGDKIVKGVKNLLPLEKKHKEDVVNEFKRVTSAVVYGLILMGLIIGVIATLGFIIFKVPNPVIWGLVTVIVSILPGLGNAIIWLPASIIKFIQGDYFNSMGLFIYGLIFISGLELFLKPKLISHKSDLHPALVVLGVFGGLALLGFTGLFFGPLILVIFITFLKHLIHEKFS